MKQGLLLSLLMSVAWACSGPTCPGGCCPEEGYVCCNDGMYCAATQEKCPPTFKTPFFGSVSSQLYELDHDYINLSIFGRPHQKSLNWNQKLSWSRTPNALVQLVQEDVVRKKVMFAATMECIVLLLQKNVLKQKWIWFHEFCLAFHLEWLVMPNVQVFGAQVDVVPNQDTSVVSTNNGVRKVKMNVLHFELNLLGHLVNNKEILFYDTAINFFNPDKNYAS